MQQPSLSNAVNIPVHVCVCERERERVVLLGFFIFILLLRLLPLLILLDIFNDLSEYGGEDKNKNRIRCSAM